MSEPAVTGPAEVLTVEASLFSARRLRDLAVAAASLPGLFRPAAGGRGSACDVRVIDAAVSSWPRLLARALDSPVRGILLSAPTVAAADAAGALAARAESIGCPVVVAMPFAYDATIRDGLAGLRDELPELSFVDAIATASDDGGALAPRSALGRALLTQLVAIRMIAAPVPGLILNYETDQAYSATAVSDRMTVMLTGLVSSLPGPVLRVDLVGARRRHTIALTGPSAGAPATFGSCGASGLSRRPPSYSGGLRGAWQNLHDAVTGARPVHFGLRELAPDLAVAASRTGP